MSYRKKIPDSESIINKDDKIYHLNLHPSKTAKDIIIVGDPERVPLISKYFDKIEIKRSRREFVIHKEILNNKSLTALSTELRCDNIDIVINELDALVNIDFKNRIPKEKLTSLNIIRIGSTGALQREIPVDSFVVSNYGLGLDGLMGFYNNKLSKNETEIQNAFLNHAHWPADLNLPYFSKGNDDLIQKIGHGILKGITATAIGFYGPQGRNLRLESRIIDLNKRLSSFSYNGNSILNFEMETSALYALSKLLGHKSCTICAVIANRFSNTYSKNYKIPIEKLIKIVLERI